MELTCRTQKNYGESERRWVGFAALQGREGRYLRPVTGRPPTRSKNESARPELIARHAAIAVLLITSVSHIARAETQAPVDPDPAKPKPKPESPVRGGARVVGFLATPFGGNQAGAAPGFGFEGSLGLQHIPLTIGFDLMVAFWGSETSHTRVRAGDALVPVDRERTDHGYFMDLSLRLQPIDWLVRPYLEGFVGSKLLETKYSLSFPNTGTSTENVSDHDWSGSIGWGAGVDIYGFTLARAQSRTGDTG